ncbi:hypothetical protein [Clostridium sp.]|uniref:hypothetical protein n=1 Tax=Clostridium sp. TaxID=1506 RepID=UPI0026331F27|nr:hypothetical protein [Clostridium sp.]
MKEIIKYLDQNKIEYEIIRDFIIINAEDLSLLIIHLNRKVKHSHCDLYDFFDSNTNWDGLKDFEHLKNQKDWESKIVFEIIRGVEI